MKHSRPSDSKHPIDYSNPKVRREILTRQRRDIWTPEQVESLARHLKLKPGLKLLDVGCGHGYALRTWGRYCLPGGELTGLDRERSLLATAKRFCRREGIADSCRFVEGDACDLPFKDNSFHVTLAHVVFCHLAEPEKALDEMIRVTRRGGCVAVFDNAMGGGDVVGWSNYLSPTVTRQLRQAEMAIRRIRGRKRLGHGDFKVGCYLPSWMEARGMRNVDIRANERVYWLAPPYRSPAQRTTWRNMRERVREAETDRERDDSILRQMRAGGATDGEIDRHRRTGRRMANRWRTAVKDRTIAFTYAGQFWCIWGFKP